jgi:hypothetical protein
MNEVSVTADAERRGENEDLRRPSVIYQKVETLVILRVL